MLELDCDILVVGGGVAGLSSALAAARSGLKTVLIERESEIGFKIRGEVVKKEAAIFTEIFNSNLPEQSIVNDLLERRIYSPSALKHIDAKHTEPTATIDYRLFILELFKELSKTNCQIFLNTKLTDIIRTDGDIKSVSCMRDQEEIKITARYFIGADGAKSKFVDFLNNPSDREVYPALKLNYENLTIPNSQRIELYLMTNPAGAMWMFPKSKSSGECGITVWTHDLPETFDILELWNTKSENHPVLGEILKDAKPYYISRDFLNFGGPLKNIFGENFVVVGDSGGHIGAIGGSGIISSIDVGFRVTEFVSRALQLEEKVTAGMIKEFLKTSKKSPIQKFLKSEQKLGILFRQILFQTFQTVDAIDENWYKLENMYAANRAE